MKNIWKTILGIGFLAIAGVVVVKTIKKETKKLEEIGEKVDEGSKNPDDLDNGEEEKIDKEQEDQKPNKKNVDENNLVYALLYAMEFGELDGEIWDRDLIRTTSKKGKSNSIDSEKVIHVIQSDTGQGEELLEFHFEVPHTTYGKNSYMYPKTLDYKETLSQAGMEVAKRFVGQQTPDIWGFVGYYVINYKIRNRDTGKPRLDKYGNPEIFQKHVRIPKKDYMEENSDSNKDQDKLLVERIKKINNGIASGNRIKFNISTYDSSLRDDEDYYDLKLETSVLMYRIAFKIETPQKNGINLEKALRCLKYFTESVEVKSSNHKWNSLSTIYNHILFHSKDGDNPKDGFSFTWYYCALPDDEEDPEFKHRRIISEQLEYEATTSGCR